MEINYINNYLFTIFWYVREFFISNIASNIIFLCRFDKNYFIYDNNIILSLINLVPFMILKNILLLFNINYLYQKDDIIYYSKNEKFYISPIIMSLNLNKLNETINIKQICNKYDNNVPLQLIFKNENICINDDDEIQIKYIKSGKICEKSFNYKNIKLYFKIDLLK